MAPCKICDFCLSKNIEACSVPMPQRNDKLQQDLKDTRAQLTEAVRAISELHLLLDSPKNMPQITPENAAAIERSNQDTLEELASAQRQVRVVAMIGDLMGRDLKWKRMWAGHVCASQLGDWWA